MAIDVRDSAAALHLDDVIEIPLKHLEIHRLNSRKDVGAIDELAESIKSQGVLNPVLVVRQNGGWALVDGMRRFAAARRAGLETIPAIERAMTDQEIAAAALVSNLQRKDLDPLEEAIGYRNWLDLNPGKTQDELAATIGKARPTISNALRLLDAPKPIQDALREKRITPAHARVALEIRDPSLASGLPLKAGVSVDDLQDAVRRKNAEYDTKGEGARAILRAALAAAKAKYPNATITWKAGQYDVVSLIATLGQPPAKIAGTFGQYLGVTLAGHDKACTCRAYELDARRSYDAAGSKLITTLERVCIDPKGYRAAKPKEKKVARSRTPKAKAKKPLTPEQIKKAEAKEHKVAVTEVARALEIPKPKSAAGAPLFKKLSVTSIPHDVARGIVTSELMLNGVRQESELLLWQRIKEMPAKKISQLAGAIIAHLIEQEASYSSDSEGIHREALVYFGVKVPAIKAPKKAKR